MEKDNLILQIQKEDPNYSYGDLQSSSIKELKELLSYIRANKRSKPKESLYDGLRRIGAY